MSDDLNRRLNAQLGAILDRHVAPIFKPGTRLAIIARTPGNDEADVLLIGMDRVRELVAKEAAKVRKQQGSE